MRMSAREACANFDKALAAVERGEQVSITRNGKTIAEFCQPKKQVLTGAETIGTAMNLV